MVLRLLQRPLHLLLRNKEPLRKLGHVRLVKRHQEAGNRVLVVVPLPRALQIHPRRAKSKERALLLLRRTNPVGSDAMIAIGG